LSTIEKIIPEAGCRYFSLCAHLVPDSKVKMITSAMRLSLYPPTHVQPQLNAVLAFAVSRHKSGRSPKCCVRKSTPDLIRFLASYQRCASLGGVLAGVLAATPIAANKTSWHSYDAINI
jgi:hypothetical protein